MRKKYLVAFIIVLLTFPALVNAKDPLWDEEGLSNATVLLYQKLEDQKASIGSATLIAKDSKYYILTASHVAKELKDDAKIIFRLKGDKPHIENLLSLTKDKPIKFSNHSVADIAIVELKLLDGNINNLIAEYSFPFEQIHGGKDLPARGADLTFLGYPIVDMEMEHFSPLIFTAYLSSGLITQQRADTKSKCNFYYLNIPSIQGCSGSGVFYSIKKAVMYYGGKKSYMIGVVHGTQSDDTGGKLAAITPSYYIRDLFEK